jgi:site-specific DNA-cytosine methylase
MKILELFCGTKSFTKEAEKLGHKCFTIDIDKKFNPTLCINILDFKIEMLNGFKPDVIWASPPCTQYSHAKRKGIRDIKGANQIVEKTKEIIKDLNPKFWIIENPQTGLLKKQPFMFGLHYEDVSYCKYGLPYRKQTRLWTNLESFKGKICKKDCKFMNGNKHISSAGNGKKEWTNKSFTTKEKYIIPKELCQDILAELESEDKTQ